MNNVISDRRTKFEVELKENSLPSHKLKIYLEIPLFCPPLLPLPLLLLSVSLDRSEIYNSVKILFQ